MFSSKTKLKVALAAGLPLVLASSLGSGSAEAAILTISCTTANLGGCNNPLGDKVFSNFGFSGTGISPTTDPFRIEYDTVTGIYEGIFNPISASGTYSGTFTYDIAVSPAGILAGNKLNAFQVNITGSTVSGGAIGTTATSASLVGGSASSSAGPGTPVAFNTGVTSATFSQTFAVTSPATITALGFAFNQRNDSQVPGPLPLLGAGAAFGFSRKLRRRVKQAA